MPWLGIYGRCSIGMHSDLAAGGVGTNSPAWVGSLIAPT